MIQRYGRTPIMHRVVEHGGVLYIGGLTAEDRSASMKGQTEQVLARLDAILTQSGSDKTKVLAATIYITEMDQKAAMNDAWTAWFEAAHLPARATLGIASLGTPDTLIEVVVTATR